MTIEKVLEAIDEIIDLREYDYFPLYSPEDQLIRDLMQIKAEYLQKLKARSPST